MNETLSSISLVVHKHISLPNHVYLINNTHYNVYTARNAVKRSKKGNPSRLRYY